MAQKDKIKTSYEFTPSAKRRLMDLKSALAMKCTGVSETRILEILIKSAEYRDLEEYFDLRDDG